MGHNFMSKERELHLLKKLRSQVKYGKSEVLGMCECISAITKTHEDNRYLHNFLLLHRPIKFWNWNRKYPIPFWPTGSYYWWKPGNREVRVKWLEEKIKQHKLGTLNEHI